MKGNWIEAEHLIDGDIFYFDLLECNLDNSHLIGSDLILTGADVVLIADDCSNMFREEILINGGHILYIDPKEKVFLIGRYSKLIENAENGQTGN